MFFKNRLFFKPERVSARNEKLLSQVYQARHNELLNTKKTEASNFNAFIESIDFDVLNSIIQAILQKCGVPESERKKRVIDKKKIFLGELGSNAGTGLPGSQLINLSVDAFSQKNYAENPRRIKILQTLIHEAVHVAGASSFDRGWWVSGVSKKRKGKELFLQLNEGITQRLSYIILARYLKSSPQKNKLGYYGGLENFSVDDFIAFESSPGFGIDHRKAVLHVEHLINVIAEKFGIAKEVAWNSLVHAAFSGLNLEHKDVVRNPELKEILSYLKTASLNEAMLGKDTLEQLAQQWRSRLLEEGTERSQPLRG